MSVDVAVFGQIAWWLFCAHFFRFLFFFFTLETLFFCISPELIELVEIEILFYLTEIFCLLIYFFFIFGNFYFIK